MENREEEGSADWKPIRILHLEDEPRDSEMVESVLKSEGMEVALTRVEEKADFEEALRSGQYEVILSDYSLPRFDGPSALELARRICPELPFIFVSGRMGEDLAVESLRHGAMDYVLKRFLSRLPPALERTLKEAQARREKALAEWELRSTEAKLAAIIENSKDHVWSLDLDLRFMTFNTSAAEAFHAGLGMRPKVGMRLDEILPEEAMLRWTDWVQRASLGEPFQIEQGYMREGVEIHYEVSLNPIRTGGTVTGVAVFSRDVSERRASERKILAQRDELEKVNARLVENQAQLIQSEKLASLGQLAAGVAHEINNPMAFVTSNLRTLEKYVDAVKAALEAHGALLSAAGGAAAADPSLKEAKDKVEALLKERKLARVLGDIGGVISESLDGAQRVNEIVQSLKSIARADEAGFEATDLHACLEDALKLAWNEIKHKAEIRREFAADLPAVQGRQGQLKQVFLNLLVNAAQAIPDKGTITVRTLLKDGRAVVEIEDSGSGISEENLSKLFTPFFTTKPVGQGTGLGLSISYGIIQNHRGEMKASSAPGKGTVFTIALPAGEGHFPESGAPGGQ